MATRLCLFMYFCFSVPEEERGGGKSKFYVFAPFEANDSLLSQELQFLARHGALI